MKSTLLIRWMFKQIMFRTRPLMIPRQLILLLPYLHSLKKRLLKVHYNTCSCRIKSVMQVVLVLQRRAIFLHIKKRLNLFWRKILLKEIRVIFVYYFNIIFLNIYYFFAVFLSWIIGHEKASHILDFEKKIDEEEIISKPDDVSNAIIEEVVLNEFDSFKPLFTPEAWSAVIQLGILFLTV